MVIVFVLSVAHSSVYAATRYVNTDSDGSASFPFRAFNDPSYTANDSYQTLTAAYTAATAGDTIEFSGGTTGKSYPGRAAGIAKQLTFQGSQISGHNSTVTIAYDATTGYAFGANADGIILQNLTFSGSNTGKALVILKNNITGTNIILKDAGGDLYHLSFAAAAGNSSTFTNLIIYGNTVGRGMTLASNTGTANINNCIMNAASNVAVYMNSGATASFTNCTFTSNGTITSNMFYYNGGGTINTTNCFVQGSYQYPLVPTAGTGAKTWNSTSDIIDGFPYLTRTKANMGYIAFSTDDTTNLDYCIANANYAINTYSIPITCYISPTQSLTEAEKTKLQTLYKAGHEVGVHTRHHNDFSKLNGITVTYSGANNDMAFVVSGSGTSLSITGTSDTHGPIDLTNSSYDTLGELCTAIGGWSNFACSVVTSISTDTLSTSLKDASTALPKTVATGIPFDDSALAANRYYTEEITNAINDLETAIHLDPSCSGYTVKTIALPYNTSSSALNTWLQANTSLLGARANSSIGTNTEKVWLGAVNVFNAYNRPDYPDFLGDGLQASVEKSARVLATYASNGFFTGMLIHSAAEMTSQQWAWMMDELVKYRTQYNITISSFANLISEIRTSGNWTNGGGGTWTRTFTGSDDFRSTYNSAMINAGTTVAGRTTDILGNPIVGTPDIGPYEFQSPVAPTSLSQYKSDGTTAISAGSWTKETSAVLKFSLSSVNSSDSFTPHVEIQPNATAFTNTQTNTGTAVVYSGTAVTGTVTVTGLSDGTIYHWQARGSNAASTGSWTAFLGGNPDFGVDTTAPTIPGTPSTTTPTATTKPVWTWTASTDGSSGLPTTPYTIQWCGNAGFTGCGANVSTSTTNTFTHVDALSDGTWYIRVGATDIAGNMSDYSLNGTVVIGTTGPTITSASSVESGGSGTGVTGKSCPDAPPGVKAPWLYSAVPLDDTHVQLYFTDADDPVDGYILIFGTASGDYQYGSIYIGNKGMRTYTVGYLSPATTYYFRVQGKHGCQPGSRSNEISATTDSTRRWNKLGISSSVVLGATAPQTPNDTLAEEHKAEPTVFTGYEMHVKVLNRNNTPVVGATVTIHSTPRQEITDSNGIAQFQNVEPGQHQISINYDGFKGEQSIALEGNTKRFDVEIKVQKENVLFSSQALTIIAVLTVIIFVLSVLLIKSKYRQRRRPDEKR